MHQIKPQNFSDFLKTMLQLIGNLIDVDCSFDQFDQFDHLFASKTGARIRQIRKILLRGIKIINIENIFVKLVIFILEHVFDMDVSF